MTILGIDPGPVQSAYVLFNAQTQQIMEKGTHGNEALLALIGAFRSDREIDLVIEQIASFGMSVGETVFETVFWSGRFAQEWGRPFHRLKRHEIKMHLCHTMKAKDPNIRQALIDKLGAPGTKKQPGSTYGISGDCWAALAVAVTFAETKGMEKAKSLLAQAA